MSPGGGVGGGSHHFFKNDDIFCGRHYADLLRNRCAACDEV